MSRGCQSFWQRNMFLDRIQNTLVVLDLQRARWSLRQARPCSWNVVYWNSTSSSHFIPQKNGFPAYCVRTLTSGTIPRFSAKTWTSITVYTVKKSVMDWRNSGFSCGFLTTRLSSPGTFINQKCSDSTQGDSPVQAKLQTRTWPEEFFNVPGKVPPTLTHTILHQ